MQYLVSKDLGYGIYLGKKSLRSPGKEYVVFKSKKEMFVGVESYVYDEKSRKLIWEGITSMKHLDPIIIGFADTEEEAIELAF
ncbi:hypothetical protein ACINWC323_2658 [Acinetobacter sp. WC-323]|uniref:hypothetical protein n=1 Tax=Acinetobacter sp. WC-323 TaxID=903918 RepID=UPI00029E15F9|nr:hypothetical protein [Acinetobacter sp. WC-323]EKU56482.1 hypothetical protein ACINWC323_2658 [Acinetobacter sp. WC-323]